MSTPSIKPLYDAQNLFVIKLGDYGYNEVSKYLINNDIPVIGSDVDFDCTVLDNNCRSISCAIITTQAAAAAEPSFSAVVVYNENDDVNEELEDCNDDNACDGFYIHNAIIDIP